MEIARTSSNIPRVIAPRSKERTKTPSEDEENSVAPTLWRYGGVPMLRPSREMKDILVDPSVDISLTNIVELRPNYHLKTHRSSVDIKKSSFDLSQRPSYFSRSHSSIMDINKLSLDSSRPMQLGRDILLQESTQVLDQKSTIMFNSTSKVKLHVPLVDHNKSTDDVSGHFMNRKSDTNINQSIDTSSQNLQGSISGDIVSQCRLLVHEFKKIEGPGLVNSCLLASTSYDHIPLMDLNMSLPSLHPPRPQPECVVRYASIVGLAKRRTRPVERGVRVGRVTRTGRRRTARTKKRVDGRVPGRKTLASWKKRPVRPRRRAPPHRRPRLPPAPKRDPEAEPIPRQRERRKRRLDTDENEPGARRRKPGSIRRRRRPPFRPKI